VDELLTTAFTAAREQIDDALNGFAKSDPEAARLLGGVMNDLHRQRSRYGADRRLASALSQVLDALTEEPRRSPREGRVNVGWTSAPG
jgi:phosphate uptake regulator